MVAAGSMSKGKKVVVNLSSSEDGVVEDDDDNEGESDSWLGQGCEEDDDESEVEEEDPETEEEEYEVDESESDQEEDMDSDESIDEEEEDSDESIDEDEECESISEDQSNDDDGNNVCDRKEGKTTDNELSDKVINLLRQRNNKLDVLKLEECKAYLRKHELMISGTKAACIQRILEHWRLKGRNGERLYPKSSFTINCTGDVCKGDVVMFKQRVYGKYAIFVLQPDNLLFYIFSLLFISLFNLGVPKSFTRFDKVSSSGKMLGKRTIAGRIVKESYGIAKQQHTFTAEVLWSKGVKPLPLLYPLLVKGRNLYRYGTFRQCWRNEAERFKILKEKHRRGAKARHVRASNQTRNYSGSKRQRKPSESRKHPSKRLKKVSESIPRKKRKQTSNSTTRLNSTSRKKLAATASFSRHSKNHGTKASSVAQLKKSKIKTPCTYPKQVNRDAKEVVPHHNSEQGPIFRNIYGHSHTHLHQRSNTAAYNHDHNAAHPVTLMREPHHHGQMMNEGIHYISLPYAGHVYKQQRSNTEAYNHDRNAAHAFALSRPYTGHVYQFDPNLRHPYSNSVSQYGSRSSGHFFTPTVHDYNSPWR